MAHTVRVLATAMALLSCVGLSRVHASGSADTAVSDWPGWRGPLRNGISPDPGLDLAALTKALDGEPDIVWQTEIGQGYSSPAVIDGRIYAMGNRDGQDTVYCLSSRNGKTVWAFSYACGTGQYPGPQASPAVADGRVYTFSRETHLYCLDARNGEVLWGRQISQELELRQPDHAFSSSPVIEEGMLIVYASSVLLALDPTTGERVWITEFPEPLITSVGGYCTPVPFEFEGAKYLALVGEDAVHVIAFDTGSIVASTPWGRSYRDYASAPDPVVSDGRVLVTAGYSLGGASFEFDGASLAQTWRNEDFGVGSQVSTPVLIDGAVYGFDGNANSRGHFYCMDFATGEYLWRTRLRYGSCIAAGNTLIVLTEQGLLLTVEASRDRFRQLSEAQLPRNLYWAPPVLSRGRLYIKNMKGDLFCLKAQ